MQRSSGLILELWLRIIMVLMPIRYANYVNSRVDCDRCDSSTFVTPPTAPIPGLGVLGAGCFRISLPTRTRVI